MRLTLTSSYPEAIDSLLAAAASYMQINPSGIAIEPTFRTTSAVKQRAIGQLLNARVLERLSADVVSLSINGKGLRASTYIDLNPGDKLQLRVSQLDPVALLTAVRSSKIGQSEQIRLSLAKALPKQQPLATTLDVLNSVTTRTPPANLKSMSPIHTNNASVSVPAIDYVQLKLPRTAVEIARHIVSIISSAQALADPKQLRSLIARSGLFAESAAQSALLSGSNELPDLDLKWQLRQLYRELQNAVATNGKPPSLRQATNSQMSGQPSSVLLNNQQPEEVKVDTRSTRQPAAGAFKSFLSLVDGAIAKIEAHQLSAFIARIDGEHAWSVELPINVAGTFKAMQVKINQQRTQSGDVQTPTTTFALELPLDEKRTLRALIMSPLLSTKFVMPIY